MCILWLKVMRWLQSFVHDQQLPLQSDNLNRANRLNPLSTPSDFKSAECQSAHFINHHYLCPLAVFFIALSFQLCNIFSWSTWSCTKVVSALNILAKCWFLQTSPRRGLQYLFSSDFQYKLWILKFCENRDLTVIKLTLEFYKNSPKILHAVMRQT